MRAPSSFLRALAIGTAPSPSRSQAAVDGLMPHTSRPVTDSFERMRLGVHLIRAPSLDAVAQSELAEQVGDVALGGGLRDQN